MTELNIQDILETLPHRYPFLLIDRVTEFVANDRIQVIKNITMNEACFQGHFPDQPVFPGVLIVEAIAQAIAVLSYRSKKASETKDCIFLLAGVDKTRFKRQVIPGDQLLIDAAITRQARNVWKFEAKATVDGELACATQITGALVSKLNSQKDQA